MIRKSFKKDFRMTAAEFERFDRVRRAQGFGFRPWSEFIRDALVKYVSDIEAMRAGKFPPAVTPPSLLNPFREATRDEPVALPAIPAETEKAPDASSAPVKKKRPAAAAAGSSKRRT